jgi:hypothetical protein
MPTILVPLDGSALAEQVFPYVQYLATTLAAQIQLLRVVSDADKEALLAYAVRIAIEGQTEGVLVPYYCAAAREQSRQFVHPHSTCDGGLKGQLGVFDLYHSDRCALYDTQHTPRQDAIPVQLFALDQG